MRGSVAKRYAKALLEVGVSNGKLDRLHKEVEELAEFYNNSADLRAVISNPSVGNDERRNVIETIAQRASWDQFSRNFALILVDNERFAAIGAIAQELSKMVDDHKGVVRAEVTSARPLKDSQVANISGAIAKLTGKDVVLTTDVDPTILGGLITKVGMTVYDGSVATQIETIKESILREV